MRHEVKLSRDQRRRRREEIAAAVEAEGLTVAEASERFGLHRLTVYRAINDAGVTPGRRGVRKGEVSDRTLQVVAELLNTADGLNVIAGRLGVSRQRVSQVYMRARGSGIKVAERPHGRPRGESGEGETGDRQEEEA